MLFRSDLEKSKQDEYFGLMMSQAKRMKSLVEDLLTLANLEANTLPASTTPIKIETVMAILKNDAEALSQGKHTFYFNCHSTDVLLGEDREVLSAFSNLVSNAIRYTPDTGTISVSWTINPQGQGEFSVADTGPGIAPEHLSRLTERFYRVDPARSRSGGNAGLGLSIAKALVGAMGGEIGVESTVGKGTQVWCVLPASS